MHQPNNHPMRPRPNIALVLAAAAATVLAACSTSTVKLKGRPQGAIALPLKGVYTATVRAPFIGPVSGRLTAEPVEGGFVANSRPDVAWQMIGGFQGLLGQIFTPFLFPGGVIITWTSGLPEDGKPAEGVIGIGGIRSISVKTRMNTADGVVELVGPDNRRVATLSLTPSAADAPPLANYPELARRIDSAVQSRLYDRSLVDSAGVRGYLAQLKSASAISRDDVEFIFGAVVAARNNVKFSIPIAIPRPDDAARRLAAEDSANPELATVRATFDKRSGFAVLKAEAFLEPEDVDRAFAKILEWKPKGLIVDIRSCPGVTLASLRVASWLIDKPTDAGAFFGPDRREDALAGKTDAFPRVEINSAAAVREAESVLDAQGAASIVIMPESATFTGPVAVLISRRTTTSAEPLAWLLKATGRARLFGTATVGRPVISRPIDIGQGWDFWLAACDFRPAFGDRINDRGVKPDVDAGRESSRLAAYRWLRAQTKPAEPTPPPPPEAPAPAEPEA